jgi:hypothetical protein
MPKSAIYLEVLPRLNSGKLQVLDHPKLIGQWTGLERRTARSGRDSVDHAPGGHDDLVNSACGALWLAGKGAGVDLTKLDLSVNQDFVRINPIHGM